MRLVPVLALAALMAMMAGVQAQPRGNRLTGPAWKAISIRGAAPAPRQSIQFNADRNVSGFEGCNYFSGSYRITSRGALRVARRGMAATLMACLNPRAEAASRRFGQMLSEVRRYRIQKRHLILTDGRGKVIGEFTR